MHYSRESVEKIGQGGHDPVPGRNAGQIGRVFAKLLAGAANGFVQCFDAEGKRLWSRFLVAPVIGLAPNRSAGCSVTLQNGTVVALDESGEIQSSGTRSAKSTAGVWAECGLVVGREDGTVECYG